MPKCITHTLLAISIFCNICCNNALANTIPTPKEYEAYLERQGDAESLELKEQFSELTKTKKKKLLNYYFNPETMKNIYSQELSPNSRKELYDGDVVIENKSTISEKVVEDQTPSPTKGIYSLAKGNKKGQRKPVVKEYTATDIKKIEVLGTYVKHTVSVKYRVINGKVTKIITGYATVEKFLYLNPVTRKSFSTYIMGNKAHGASIWEMSLPILKNKLFDLSPIAIIKHHEVHGYPNGQVTWSFWS